MKAAVNGVPQLGTLDGWWLEGCIEDRTGWAIERPGLVPGPTAWSNGNGHGHGAHAEHELDEKADTEASAESLYAKLERKVLPVVRGDREAFADIMRHCIALNGSFFSSQRMLSEYVRKAYFR
jgi:starch phosphorylase